VRVLARRQLLHQPRRHLASKHVGGIGVRLRPRAAGAVLGFPARPGPECHDPRPGVRTRDAHPLPPPDQIHAPVRHNPLLMLRHRGLLPRARDQRRADHMLDVAHNHHSTPRRVAIPSPGSRGARCPSNGHARPGDPRHARQHRSRFSQATDPRSCISPQAEPQAAWLLVIAPSALLAAQSGGSQSRRRMLGETREQVSLAALVRSVTRRRTSASLMRSTDPPGGLTFGHAPHSASVQSFPLSTPPRTL
jgi:hypothetical protein